MVAQVRQLRAQGMSYRAIGERTGRVKTYVAWLVQAKGIDSPGNDDLAPVPVGA